MRTPLLTFAIGLALGGCAGGVDSESGPGAPVPPPGDGSGAGGGVVSVGLRFFEQDPTAGPSSVIHVAAEVSAATSVAGYSWRIVANFVSISFRRVTDDSSQIEFVAGSPGIYDVRLDVALASGTTMSVAGSINVSAMGARVVAHRMRIVPPPGSDAPPVEMPVAIRGGASSDRGVTSVDTGMVIDPVVRGPDGQAVQAYLRFSPQTAPDAVVEAFADGPQPVALSLGFHDVLVIPSDPANAPRLIEDWSPLSNLPLDVEPGMPVSGTVLDPENQPVAGAQVQLSVTSASSPRATGDGVPSTLATTGADGRFTVRAMAQGSRVTVEVTPPAASGLPKLSATAAFDLGAPWQIHYSEDLRPSDLVGVQLQHNAVAVPDAQVTIVGSQVNAGTVTAGVSAMATGEVRIAAIADANGTLPRIRVPPAALSAVIRKADGDLAVVVLDTTAVLPARIDVPAMQEMITLAQGPGASVLDGAVLDIVPVGALAMAAVPAVHLVANKAGLLENRLAIGGRYELRFRDPVGRAAPLVVAEREVASIASAYELPAAIKLSGTLRLDGTQVLANAWVQILCNDGCRGLDRERPIAEAISDNVGRYVLAIPDPGVQ